MKIFCFFFSNIKSKYLNCLSAEERFPHIVICRLPNICNILVCSLFSKIFIFFIWWLRLVLYLAEINISMYFYAKILFKIVFKYTYLKWSWGNGIKNGSKNYIYCMLKFYTRWGTSNKPWMLCFYLEISSFFFPLMLEVTYNISIFANKSMFPLLL